MPARPPTMAQQRLDLARRLRADAERRADLAERHLAASLGRERRLIVQVEEMEARLAALEPDVDTDLESPSQG